LTGTEVKSLRAGRASLADAFARIENGEVWLYHLHIPLRKRKLLLHHGEIRRLFGKAQVKGYTLVPLRLYFKHGIVKVELAVARGKRQYDKRAAIEKREAQRRMEHALRRRR